MTVAVCWQRRADPLDGALEDVMFSYSTWENGPALKKRGVEILAEARNLVKSTVTTSQGSFAPFADGVPSLNGYTYGGARYMVGLVARY